MAYPTLVNSRITDAVTQQNVSVLASAPAIAMGTIYQSAAHSIGVLYQNATLAQQQGAISAYAFGDAFGAIAERDGATAQQVALDKAFHLGGKAMQGKALHRVDQRRNHAA